MTATETRAFPFGVPERLEVDPLFTRLRHEQPLCRVQLPYGEPALLARWPSSGTSPGAGAIGPAPTRS